MKGTGSPLQNTGENAPLLFLFFLFQQALFVQAQAPSSQSSFPPRTNGPGPPRPRLGGGPGRGLRPRLTPAAFPGPRRPLSQAEVVGPVQMAVGLAAWTAVGRDAFRGAPAGGLHSGRRLCQGAAVLGSGRPLCQGATLSAPGTCSTVRRRPTSWVGLFHAQLVCFVSTSSVSLAQAPSTHRRGGGTEGLGVG